MRSLRCKLVSGLYVLVLFVAAKQVGRAAVLHRLGDLPGGHFISYATAVSADGRTVVGQGTVAEGGRAFRWEALSGIKNLNSDPAVLVQTHPWDITPDGRVVVGRGVNSTESTAVSSDGEVVAGWSNLPSGVRGFRWTRQTGMQAVGDLPGGADFSFAYGISADGNILVGESSSARGTEAFRWDHALGQIDPLGDLPGGDFQSVAREISPDGGVIVGYGNTGFGREAFRWTHATGMVGLGNLPGRLDSDAWGVSSNGEVIVGEGRSLGVVPHAFVWDAVHGMRDLNDLVASQATGLRLSVAFDVSPDGRYVVGAADLLEGGQEAFLIDLVATVPKPSSGALVAGAMASGALLHLYTQLVKGARARTRR
jgi:probable HAF family extracellular repeat protein